MEMVLAYVQIRQRVGEGLSVASELGVKRGFAEGFEHSVEGLIADEIMIKKGFALRGAGVLRAEARQLSDQEA